MYIGELLCSGLARSVQSLLPWDIPWHDPSHAVFFIAFYGALGAIGMGVMAALGRTLLNLFKSEIRNYLPVPFALCIALSAQRIA